MGAWIETDCRATVSLLPSVAPYVGAWIETKADTKRYNLNGSHPTWVRGLKLNVRLNSYARQQSHPTWVRGLKQAMAREAERITLVAPYVGAWIETCRVGMT